MRGINDAVKETQTYTEKAFCIKKQNEGGREGWENERTYLYCGFTKQGETHRGAGSILRRRGQLFKKGIFSMTKIKIIREERYNMI